MKKLTLLFICCTITCTVFSQTKILTLEQFGAKADGVVAADGDIAAGSNVLESNSANFTTADIGKIIFVAGALKNGNTLIGIISAVNSKTSVTISAPATANANSTGITYGTDCTDAFIKFNKAARIYKNVVLNMKPGTYLTKFNNYLAGIKNITLNGNGCNLICTRGAYDPLIFARANVGLFMPSCYDNVDNNYFINNEPGNTSFGYKIQSTSKATRSVQTISNTDAVSFKPGNWVFVYGLHHEDFGGWPPNPFYFEYAKVKSVDYSTGKIYLDRPLNSAYDAGWPDGKGRGGIGAARIINLNRDNFTTIENLNINNINFAPFNGWNGKLSNDQRNSRIELYGFIYGKITNVTAAAAYFGQGKKLVVDHVNITGGCEPDKGLDTCIIKNSKITQLINAGGLHYLFLLNNTFYGGFNSSPLNLYINGNTFVNTTGTTTQSLAAFGFNQATNYIEIGTNTWDCSNGKRTFLISPTSTVTMTVGAVVDTDVITIPYDTFVSAHNSRRIIPGASGSTASGKTFRVKRVYQYDANNIAVSGTCTNGQPVKGDAYIFQMAPKIKITGKQLKVGASKGKYALFQRLSPANNLELADKSFSF